MPATMILPVADYRDIISHLLSNATGNEEAAFVFAKTKQREGEVIFQCTEWFAVQPDGFSLQSQFCLELSDETRGAVIKRAHDLSASIIEFHSHPRGPARFSWSDKAGLLEFVPHVLWRLGGRPYGAVVVAPTGCDALAWVEGNIRSPISKIVAGDRIVRPNGWTFEHWDEIDVYAPV